MRTRPIQIGGVRPRPTGRFYRPELDGLRFIAFFLVFSCHATGSVIWLPPVGPFLEHLARGGSFGVDLFFLLSAYLITELLLREKLATGSIDVSGFYMRRILRIWPLYFAFLGFFLVARTFTHTVFPNAAFAAFALFCGNWYLAGLPPDAPLRSPVVPLWSVSVEEQFYLAWPLVVRFASKAGMVACAIGLCVTSWIAQFIMLRAGALHSVIWVNSFVHGGAIGAGILSAIWLQGRAPSIHRAVRLVMFLCAMLLFAIADFQFHFTAPRSSIADGMLSLNCGWLGIVLLFYSLLGAPQDGLKFTAASVLAYLGRISYGAYVFHIAALDLVRYLFVKYAGRPATELTFALALLLTLVAAATSYRWYETPFLALKRRFTHIQSGMAKIA